MGTTLIDQLWVIIASALVFLMQAGFAMVESGMTRSKHSINVAVKNLTDFGVSGFGFWIAGFGLMFGLSASGLIGTTGFFFDAADSSRWVFFLFQTMFCSTAATIVSGAVAERMRFSSYIITTTVLSLLIYPVFGHWAWGGVDGASVKGWLASMGFVDFAGSTVVHSVGGWSALALLLILGPRTGRYRPDGSTAPINGSNIPMAILGVCLLWFGWIGFNGGSTLAMNDAVAGIIARTVLGGIAGMLGALALGWPLFKKPDVNLLINGSLAGLVAITANCHVVNAVDALIIGAIGGILMVGSTILIDKWHIDDAVGAIPVHLVGGIWGTLAVAIFGDPALLGTGLDLGAQLGIQALGLVLAGVWAFSIAFGTTWIINKIRPIRVSLDDEQRGLNVVEHGVSTEINDLFHTLQHQAQTGDISLRAPVEPFTEAGQIASMYNTVMDRLEENTVAKGEYIQIMRNVGDGLFLLDRNSRINPYYSAALARLFDSDELAGMYLPDMLEAYLSPDMRTTLVEYLSVAFDETYAWRHVEKLNPLADLAINRPQSDGSFVELKLQFHFRRIEENGRIDRLMVLVRDLTAESQLSEELEQTREQGRHEMELLYRVLHVEPQTLSEFIDGVHRDLEAINRSFRNTEGDIKERLTDVFRLTHAIKGDAELLDLGFLGEKAEVMEEKVRELLGKDSPQGEDFLALTLLFSDLNTANDELRDLVGKLRGFQAPVTSTNKTVQTPDNKDFLAKSLHAMAERLGERYGKQVQVLADTRIMASLPARERQVLRDIIVQISRNAVFHGLETPLERRGQSKGDTGTLKVNLERQGQGYRLRCQDDGKGLDFDAIESRALERGLISRSATGTAPGERELLPLIFHPGFSTAEKADQVGGKGIGLSLVRNLTKELGGTIKVTSKPGQGTSFTFDFPELGSHGN